MSSFSPRPFVLLAPVLLLLGCGFAPVYGPDGSAGAVLGRVVVDVPTTRDAYLLVEALEQHLGRARDPRFHLSYDLTIIREGMALDAAGDTTRVQLLGTAHYQLRTAEAEAPLHTGVVRNFTAYSNTGTTVETLAAQSDARRRLTRILADEIAQRLLAADLGAS